MTSKTSSVDIATIREDQSVSDYDLMERMATIQQLQEQKEKEREKEALKKDPDATLRAYRYAHHFCHPRCGYIVDKRDEAAWIAHKSQCGWQIELAEQKAKEKMSRVDGNCKMRYILHSIENSKTEIEDLRRKIEREKREKQPNWELVVSMSEQKILELENHIHKEEGVELHKLLKHPNEITREAAQELYDAYLKMSEAQRSRCQY
jgi:hypothetical protein